MRRQMLVQTWRHPEVEQRVVVKNMQERPEPDGKVTLVITPHPMSDWMVYNQIAVDRARKVRRMVKLRLQLEGRLSPDRPLYPVVLPPPRRRT